MASLVTQMFVAEKYGLRLNVDDLADLLKLTKVAIYNQISTGNFGIKVYKDAGKTWADYRDVAEYLDECRERSRATA